MLAFSHQEHIESYYSVTRNQHFELPPLNQKESADVCIVGAGFFGLSTALELAEQGVVAVRPLTVLKTASMNISNK